MSQPTPNELLTALVDQRESDPGIRASLGNLFLTTTVWVPSVTDPTSAAGFQPAIVDRNGIPHMVALVSPVALEGAKAHFQFLAEMPGTSLVSSVIPGVGILIDTGVTSLAFPPEMVADLKDRVATQAVGASTQPQGQAQRERLNELMAHPASDPASKLAMADLFLEAAIAIPSTGDPLVQGGYQPLVVAREGHQFMIVATHADALVRLKPAAPYVLETTGRSLVPTIPPDVGVLLDSGTASFAFVAATIAELKHRITD